MGVLGFGGFGDLGTHWKCIGDVFGKYSGQTVKVDDIEYLVMREEDIMGIVE